MPRAAPRGAPDPPAPATAPSPTIAVQKARGRPKLEAIDGGLGPGGPAAAPAGPPQPLPPPPAAAAPIFGPEVQPEPVRRPWTPEEAALAATGAHNVAWTGAFFLRKELTQRELLEKAYADPKELDAAAPSIARILDHSPLEPGGAGTLGLLGDVLVTAQAFVSLEVRHATLVEEARRRLKEKGHEAGPRPSGSAPARPAPVPPSTPREDDDVEPIDDSAFRFRPDQLQVLGP
jgi:hypothetical protein